MCSMEVFLTHIRACIRRTIIIIIIIPLWDARPYPLATRLHGRATRHGTRQHFQPVPQGWPHPALPTPPLFTAGWEEANSQSSLWETWAGMERVDSPFTGTREGGKKPWLWVGDLWHISDGASTLSTPSILIHKSFSPSIDLGKCFTADTQGS